MLRSRKPKLEGKKEANFNLEKALITPVIRTAVNPVDGSELSHDPNYVMLGASAKYMAHNSLENPDDVEVGERRNVLKTIFYNRAYSLFYTVLNVVNNNCDIELSAIIDDMGQDPYGYPCRFGGFFTFESVLNSRYYSMQNRDLSKRFPAVDNINEINNPLLDLQFYVQISENTAYEAILTYISSAVCDATNILTKARLTAKEYSDAQEIILKYTIDTISLMESVVGILYKEARELYSLGYNSKSGIPYQLSKRVTEIAHVDHEYNMTRAAFEYMDSAEAEESKEF